jgi:hypothetical protein
MTICISEKTKDKITLGADSASFYCDNYVKQLGVNKIQQINNIAITGTGDASIYHTLSDFINTKEVSLNNILDVYILLNEFMALLEKVPDKEWVKDNAIYIADRNTFKLFKVVDCSSVREMKEGEFDIVGQGYEIAQYMHERNREIKDIIQEVIRTHTYTGGEPNILEIKR